MTGPLLIPPAPNELDGEIRLPGDKSISHRAVMFAALSTGTSHIVNCSLAKDNKSTISAFKSLGVDITWDGAVVTVRSDGRANFNHQEESTRTIDCGNSGTTIRLLCGILSASAFDSFLDGDNSLRTRPMGRVADPLRRMGASIHFQESSDCAPLRVNGRKGALHGLTYESPVASAQVKSAILLAGLYAKGITTVIEPARSRDHTERLLPRFGAAVRVEDCIVSVKGETDLQACDVHVPGDFSSAAFFIAAALLLPGSRLCIRDVGLNPTRTGVLDIFRAMGAKIKTENERFVEGEPLADILVEHSSLNGISINGETVLRAIDEIPIVAVVMALADGQSVIQGARELRAKESDRIKALAEALGLLGVQVTELPDGLLIKGCAELKGGRIRSLGDHRIAMAFSVAGVASSEGVEIEQPECVEISFPGYYGLLQDVTGVRLPKKW